MFTLRCHYFIELNDTFERISFVFESSKLFPLFGIVNFLQANGSLNLQVEECSLLLLSWYRGNSEKLLSFGYMDMYNNCIDQIEKERNTCRQRIKLSFLTNLYWKKKAEIDLTLCFHIANKKGYAAVLWHCSSLRNCSKKRFYLDRILSQTMNIACFVLFFFDIHALDNVTSDMRLLCIRIRELSSLYASINKWFKWSTHSPFLAEKYKAFC